jgi:hypothetical protein
MENIIGGGFVRGVFVGGRFMRQGISGRFGAFIVGRRSRLEGVDISYRGLMAEVMTGA